MIDPLRAARAANLALDATTEPSSWSALCVQRMLMTGILLGKDSGWRPQFGGLMIEADDGGAPFGSDPDYVLAPQGRQAIHAWLVRISMERVEMLDPSAPYFERMGAELSLKPRHPLPDAPFYWKGMIDEARGAELWPGVVWRAVRNLTPPPIAELRESVREAVGYARALLAGVQLVTPSGRFSLQ